MARRQLRKGRILGVLLLALGAVALYRTSTAQLPAAAPHARVAPRAPTAPAFKACWIEYATDQQPAFASSAGWTDRKEWTLDFPGVLIRHPGGDVLFDAGHSTRAREELKDAAFVPRTIMTAMSGAPPKRTARQAVEELGADPTKLKAFIPTHAHFDHLGGLMDLPAGVPVRLPREEMEFLRNLDESKMNAVVPAQKKRALEAVQELTFEPKPYENFDESADLFGDGSVVAVKLPGHTPGHLGVFVNLTERDRFFYVGDAVNVTEGYERRVGKSFMMKVSDYDPVTADATVAKLAQLHEMVPELAILPAHDRDAWVRFFGTQPRCVEGGAKPAAASPAPP